MDAVAHTTHIILGDWKLTIRVPTLFGAGEVILVGAGTPLCLHAGGARGQEMCA